MPVVLTTPPPVLALSADKITAKFTCTGIYDQVGVTAINTIPLPGTVAPGAEIIIKYGSTSITMVAAPVPDVSGEQFISGVVSTEVRSAYFQANYLLSRDFNITVVGANMLLTAKRTGLGFNIESYNTTAGVTEIIKSNYSLQFRLFCENPANNGYDLINEDPVTVSFLSIITAEAIIGERLHSYITDEVMNNLPDVPADMPVVCKKSCRKYYFEFAEVYGDIPKVKKVNKSDVYTVLHGGLSSIGQATKTIQELLSPGTIEKDCFLKQGTFEESTTPDQPQYLYFFNTRLAVNASLYVKFYFTNGSVASKKLHDVLIPDHRKVAFNVQFDKIFIAEDYPTLTVEKYELWLTDNSSAVISVSHIFYLDYRYLEYQRYFMNWSSWGTMDSRMFFGKGSVEFDLVQSEAQRSDHDPFDIEKGSSLIYSSSIKSRFTVTTGFIKKKSDLLFNRDFFLSILKYRFYEGMRLPIKTTTKTIEELQDGNNLYAQKFEYEYLFEDSAYTEGDITSVPEIPTVNPGQVYFGPASSRPVTEIDVTSLPNMQSPEIYLMPLYTGVNRIFVVALPPGKSIGNAYDQTSDENVTTEYIPTSIVIDDLTYKVFIMEMAISYSSNHDHIITIINE